MNDHHLDPPDDDDIQACCDRDDVPDEMLGERYDPDPFACVACGKKTNGCLYCDECSEKLTCAHGKPLGHCDACDHAAELAYDAARESRGR